MGRFIASLCLVFGTLALLVSQTARAETLELSNGDKLSGEVVESTGAHVVLESPLFGRVTIPREQIVPAKEDAGAFGTGWLRGWTRTIALGASGASGNTEKASLNGALELAHEDDRRRWKFAAAYFWGSSNNTEDTNKAFVDLERDWKLPDSSFYLFGRTGYDYDSFRSFRHRVDGSLGVGYWWLEREGWRLGTRLGAGGSYQWQNESTFRPELVAGIDSIWPIAEGHSFEIHADVFSDLSDIEEFRTRSTAEWKFAMTEVLGLSLGVLHEYVSDTAREKSDLTYRGALTYGF